MRVNCGHLRMYSSKSIRVIRLFNPHICGTASRNGLALGQCRLYGKYGGYGRSIRGWIKEQQLQVAQACTRQFEFIVAQRIRRTMQFVQLCTKIWDDVALRKLMNSWRHRFGRNMKDILFGAVGVTVFNWDQERITDDELNSYSEEIDATHSLRDSTVVCPDCQLRLVIDSQQTNVEYCTCNGSKPRYASDSDDIEWKPFIERQDMLIWRRVEPDSGGLYTYKVYGSFSDVSAQEFLQVQVDVNYRKVWDSTAKELEIIDTDPMSISAEDHRSDIVYWELVWPMLFCNRDYVYQRRWVVDKEKGIVLIVSRSANHHPSAPNRPDAYRVTSYWSYMVIKPYTSMDEPGIEFSLTYFDDPGLNIPSAVVAWVAMRGLPDFLCRMRQAAKDYKKYVASNNLVDDQSCEVIVVNDDRETRDRVIEKDDRIEEERGENTVELITNELKRDIDDNMEIIHTDDAEIVSDIEISVDQSEEKRQVRHLIEEEASLVDTDESDRFQPKVHSCATER